MEYYKNKSDICVKTDFFNLEQTFSCGQCFRFDRKEDGSYFGVASGRALTISQRGNEIVFHQVSMEDFENFWMDYFDFLSDYEPLKKKFSKDPTLQKACAYAGGLRLLRQEPFETLCSFILSSNNHIPRIKGMVARLCALLGDPIKEGVYSFPSAEALAKCSIDDLKPVRAGYRGEYLLDAARKITEKKVDMQKGASLPLDDASNMLQQIKGVGPKVASCVLLYGYHRLDAFPVDVWIKRALQRFYPNGLCREAYPEIGLAQQYLFHYIRTCKEACVNFS